MSRSFLYLTPRFAPSATVGALRAVKFCRHLPACGWRPVVLCDVDPSRGYDPSLNAMLPPEVVVRASWRPANSVAQGAAASSPDPAGDTRSALRRKTARAVRAVAPWLIDLPRALAHELRLPVSPREVTVLRHAVSEARALVRRERCEAIVASGPPWEALVVGTLVARLESLPLLLDLRDPWSLCRLERRSRSWLEQRRAELLERWCIAQADKVFLNTQQALDDYRAAYGPQHDGRFVLLRNHAEAGPPVASGFTSEGSFRLVMPGRMRDRSMSNGLIEALRLLRADGLTGEELRLEVAAPLSHRAAEALVAAEVTAFVEQHAWRPFADARGWMAGADLLVVVTPEGDQRIPAKFYDCLAAARPLLLCGSTPELRAMTDGMEAIFHCDRHDGPAIATAIRLAMARRGALVSRDTTLFSSRVAAEQLARHLEAVAGAADVVQRPQSE